MSRNNDSLPMLPPWLSESDVTQVGYEAPVENLPQDDEIDEAPKRRRFMSRGDDAPRKEKGRRRRKDRESEDEAAQQSPRSAEPVDQRRPAEQAPQSGWSTQPPANPLIPGPSHQQPRHDEQPRQQPTYEQQVGREQPQPPSHEQRSGRDYPQPPSRDPQSGPDYRQPPSRESQSGPDYQQPPSREAQSGPDQSSYRQPSTGWQADPNPLVPPPNQSSAADSAPRSNAHGPSASAGPVSADSAPWNTGQPSPTSPAPWPTGQSPAEHAPMSFGQGPSTGTPHANGPTGTESAPPQHTTPPQAGPAAQAGPTAHAGPATHTKPAAHAEPAAHTGPPAHAEPAAHTGPPAHAESAAHADPALPAESDHGAESLPTRTPAAPSTGFTPLGPNQQRPDLPPPPPLPDRPDRPTQAPPRLTAPVSPREVELPADAAPLRDEHRQADPAGTAENPTATAESQASWDPFAEGTPPSTAAVTPSAPTPSDFTSTDTQSGSARAGERFPHAAGESARQDTPTPSEQVVPEAPSHSAQSGTRSAQAVSEPEPQSHAASTPTDYSAPDTSSGTRSAQAVSEPEPQSHAASTPTDYSAPDMSSEARSPYTTGESAARPESPYSSGESVAPQQPVEQRSPYASGEGVPPSNYPASQYNSVPGDPAPVVPTHAPDGRTEVFRSDDPRLRGRATGEHGQAGWQGGATAAEQARATQTGYRSGEFVQAADAASPYPRPDGTPAQHQQPDDLPTYGPDDVAQRDDLPTYGPDGIAQPDGLPTYGADGIAQRPDGVAQQRRPEAAPAQDTQPDGAPAPLFQQRNQAAQQQFLPNGPSQPYQPDGPAQQHGQQNQPDGTAAQQPNSPDRQYLPDGTPAHQYQPDGAPAQQYQPNGPGQQYRPDGTPLQHQQPNGPDQQYQPNGPSHQYQPDGTPAQQYQQPNAAPQYQQPGHHPQPGGQPGWGAQPQGYQPSLDNVPVKRAKKAPGSGWRKAVHHVSGGAINPGMSAEELRLQELVARIRQPVRGDYRIAVLSLKGGVGKTTTTTGLGSIFASIRGDRVIAVDANPDFGTLSQRVAIQTRSTVRDLLLDSSIQRYSDVRRHTSQGSSRLEVLASERDPAASEAFNDEEYRAVARILQRFYNIILTDCGTGLMHSAMSGVLDLAHSLVLISSAAIDGARSAAATLDWLSLHGHDHLVRNAVVVINLPREGSPNVGIQQLREYFLSRCRAVHIIPFDEHLSEGAEIDLHRLHKSTKRAYVELAATVADEFGVQHHRLG